LSGTRRYGWRTAATYRGLGVRGEDRRVSVCDNASEQVNKIYSQRAEFIDEDRTGFVWLYLRK
jgi:hypothetical protein